ncbi:MAG: hypothetical protein WAZ77_14465 [Candidatus Nitrosopolaris sp.]
MQIAAPPRWWAPSSYTYGTNQPAAIQTSRPYKLEAILPQK